VKKAKADARAKGANSITKAGTKAAAGFTAIAEAKFMEACKTEKFKTVRWSGVVDVVVFEE